MFKKNNYHLQPALISTISKLPEKSLKLLKLTDLKKLYTDGGYGTPEIEKALAEEHADQVQIANHGWKPSSEKLYLSDFEIKQTEGE